MTVITIVIKHTLPGTGIIIMITISPRVRPGADRFQYYTLLPRTHMFDKTSFTSLTLTLQALNFFIKNMETKGVFFNLKSS